MKIFFAVFAVFAFLVSNVAAQRSRETTAGAGKVEIGGFPMGATAFVGGDDDREVNFNVYSSGANLSCYVNERVAIEGELGISFGLAQDVNFKRAQVLHVQMPNVWNYFGNVVWFPSGATGRTVAPYITAGAGAVSLQSRQPTGQFGYDSKTVGFQTFLAENIGGGIKIFRGADAPDWGFRIDYRYLIVNANSNAPAFFARAKSRGGHRVSFGVLFTAKR